MRTTKSITCIAVMLGVFVLSPTMVVGSTVYFDSAGNVVDKTQHEQMVAEREKSVNLALGVGYSAEPAGWKDPIRLRQKRIEQWKQMRATYDPGSLPSKIEVNP